MGLQDANICQQTTPHNPNYNVNPTVYVNLNPPQSTPTYSELRPEDILRKHVMLPICECGKDKHGFANHSTWCQKYA